MPASSPLTDLSGAPVDLRTAVVVGGAAGVLAVAGIKATDRILRVSAFGFTSTAAASPATPTVLPDLTSQFSIPADGQITNAGGTATTNNIVLVVWATRNTRLQ